MKKEVKKEIKDVFQIIGIVLATSVVVFHVNAVMANWTGKKQEKQDTDINIDASSTASSILSDTLAAPQRVFDMVRRDTVKSR